MHAELAAVFDEHRKPTHASKRDVHDVLGPISDVAGRSRMQSVKLRAMLIQAELAAHDHALDPKIEHLMQTLGAIDREATAVELAGRNLAQAWAQWDRYMAAAERDISAILGNIKAAAEPRDAASTLSLDPEAQKLKKLEQRVTERTAEPKA